MAKKGPKKPDRKRLGAVQIECATEEVILALRAYLGGIKTGLGNRNDPFAKAKKKEIRSKERQLLSMERKLKRSKEQSQGVIVVFTKTLREFILRHGGTPTF